MAHEVSHAAYLTQVSHLPDVLDFILSCPGGNHHLGAPLSQLADYIRPNETITTEHGSSDATCLRAKDEISDSYIPSQLMILLSGAPMSDLQVQLQFPCSAQQTERSIPSRHQRRGSLARHLKNNKRHTDDIKLENNIIH